jgi:type II secretory pathway pseudopilin PulG
MSKNKKTIKAGFTLIELMVAAASVTIVLFAAAVMVVFGQKSWNQELLRSNLQRDASLAMLKMKRSICSATQVQLDKDALEMKLFQTTKWVKYRYIPDEKDLCTQIEGEEEQTILDGTVEDVTFAVDPNTNKMVLVDIELEKNNCKARLSSKTMMRNCAK